jgi:hypothetical protein
MAHTSYGNERNSRLLKQLATILLLFFSLSSILFSWTISESLNEVWLDHTNLDGDDDFGVSTDINEDDDESGLAIHKRQSQHKNTLNWTEHWLQSIPSNHNASPFILYVHVGKTGGIALEKGVPIRTPAVIRLLSCIMQDNIINQHSLYEARKICQSKAYSTQPNLAQLARHILAHKHLGSSLYKQISNQTKHLPDMMGYATENLDTILVTTRNPIDRIVSSFNYLRNELVENLSRGQSKKVQKRLKKAKSFQGKSLKESFYNCFPDVRFLADELTQFFHLSNTTNPSKQSNNAIIYNGMTCNQLAHRLLSRTHPQRIKDWSHYTSNYRWYKELTIDKRPEVPVLVVRTEYLWQDAANIEIALGGKASNFINSDQTMSHGSEKYAVTAKLETDLQRRALCCAMYDDLQVYQDIIMRALNLDLIEKKDMMSLVYKDCGVGVDGLASNALIDEGFWKDWYTRSCGHIIVVI